MERAASAARTLAVLGVTFALAVTGCSIGATPATKSELQQTTTVQMCADCNGKGAPPQVPGSAKVESGVQVIRVGVSGGYYSPNALEAKAGTPIRLVFAGPAKGCLAKPAFSALGKKADFSAGTARLDLGTLAPGTYSFTCAMGKNAGSLVVR